MFAPVFPRLKIVVLLITVFLHVEIYAEVHIYTVEDAELRIYPTDIPLTIRQRHAALIELANRMKYGTAQDQVDFARIALYEMAGLYDEVAIRQDESVNSKGLALTRWRKGTQALAGELYRIADSIELQTPVDISIADTGEIHLLINEKIYILGSPLINKPFLLDERIIGNICKIKYCDPDTFSIELAGNKRTISIEANWVITGTEKPQYVTSDGLHFVFDDLENRSLKQIASLKVIKELRLISDSLREARQKGVVMEWDKLVIQSLQGSYDYRIRINQFGDTLYVKLPELYHVGKWQDQVMPWIEAQVEEKSVNQYLDADQFLAYALIKSG